MALPSSGQISFSDVRTEMEQTSVSSYAFSNWAIGLGIYDGSPYYTPINVHSGNSGKYDTNTPFNLNQWKGYDRSLNYASDGTQRDLYFSIPSTVLCYPSSMIVFDLGTTSETKSIYVSGSAADFSLSLNIALWHGKPWDSSAGSPGGAHLIWIDSPNQFSRGVDTTVNYSYTYGTSNGQYLYAVIYGNCP
jgi:hypothetical protein